MLLVAACLLLACRSTEESAGTADELASAADSLTSPRTTTWQVGPHPESVTIDGARVYVTQFGPALEPMTQDGDGYIAVYDANGQLLDTLVAGLDAPKGSEVVAGILYVADVDTLFGFSLATGAMTFAKPMPGNPQFLNGLTATPAGELYVSATDAGKVWRVTPATGAIEEIAQLPGANGLAYEPQSNTLYGVVYPQNESQTPGIYRIDLASGVTTRIGTYGGVLDGLAVVGGQLYATDWNPGGAGRMIAVDLATGDTRVVVEDASFTGPADFDVLGDGLALIPMLMEDRIVTVRLQ